MRRLSKGRAWPGALIAVAMLTAQLAGDELPGTARRASQYIHSSWTLDDGLPHSTVRAITQSADGNLWVGTYEGLARFNGFGFRVISRSTSPAIPNNSVIALLRGRDGALWIGTNHGLARMDGETITTIDGAEGAEGPSIQAIAESADGTLWAATNGSGLLRVSGGRVTRFGAAEGFGSEILSSLAIGHDGAVWAGTNGGGLVRVSRGTVTTISTAEGLGNDVVLSLVMARDGGLWIGCAQGLFLLRDVKISGPGGRAPLAADSVSALLEDLSGTLWIGTYSRGLFRYDRKRDELARYDARPGLLDESVRTIFEDVEGGLWLGTNGGLERLDAGAVVSYTTSEGLTNDYVRSVLETRDGAMWIGTAGGLARLRDGRFTIFDVSDGLAASYVFSLAEGRDGTLWIGTPGGLSRARGDRFETVLTTKEGLSNNSVRAIHEGRDGTLWLGTDLGLNAWRGGVVTTFGAADGLGSDYVMGLAEGADGTMWVATDGGGVASIGGGTTRRWSVREGMSSDHILSIAIDTEGVVWAGSDGEGLNRIDRDGVSVFTTKHGLEHDKILQILDDGAGRLWLGSTRGIFAVSKAELAEVKSGRRSEVGARVLGRSDGMASLQCNGASQPSSWRSRDGRLWFATAGGLSTLDPAALAPVVDRPLPLVVEELLADGVPMAVRERFDVAPGTSRLEVRWAATSLRDPQRIHYRYRLEGYDPDWVAADGGRSAIYTHVPPGRYAFRVAARLGQSGPWTEAPAIGVVFAARFWETRWFLALTIALVAAFIFAAHRARLRGLRNRERLLSGLVEERTQTIVEEQRKTKEALAEAEEARRVAERHERIVEEALVEADAARREAERNGQLLGDALAAAEEANRAKSVFLATTSHELRTPLNAIIGFADILLARLPEPAPPKHRSFLQNIQQSGVYLLGIINNILDLSKVEAGKLEFYPEPISVEDTVDGIREVMRGVTGPRGIAFDVDLPPALPLVDADPLQFKQILYNLVSNAVKFSPNGARVLVSARQVGDALELRVRDEGIGIAAGDREAIFEEFRQVLGAQHKRPQGTGLGLALVARFVEMHGGEVAVESEVGKGSTFVVTLPLDQRRRREREAGVRVERELE